ncbi:MAG: hypothetical protein R3B40_15655 [Polyangiales bacterium]|nr:hypothetical protein [Sandaracinaceae bacterium]
MALPIPAGLEVLSYDDVWFALVSSAAGVRQEHLMDWQQRAGALVLPTNMERWPTAVRRSFMTDLQVPAVSVGEIGQFDTTRLEGVPLVAESDAAAQQWAEWLLWDGISAYVVPSDIDRARHAVRGQFPLHRPNLPDANELLRRARSAPQDRTARFILAPADLGLWS